MRCYTKTIAELRDMYDNRQIDLEPPYQRKPAWRTRQRILLLSSLFNGIPIPALIFHKHFRSSKAKDVYDVLDGKQRLETILHFIDRDVRAERAWGKKLLCAGGQVFNLGIAHRLSIHRPATFRKEGTSNRKLHWKVLGGSACFLTWFIATGRRRQITRHGQNGHCSR